MSEIPIIGEKKAASEEAVADPTVREVQRAFTVIQHLDGSWEAIPTHKADVQPILPCSAEDMAAGAHAIENAIQASQIAAACVQYQMMMARQIQEQQQNQQLLQGLNLKG